MQQNIGTQNRHLVPSVLNLYLWSICLSDSGDARDSWWSSPFSAKLTYHTVTTQLHSRWTLRSSRESILRFKAKPCPASSLTSLTTSSCCTPPSVSAHSTNGKAPSGRGAPEDSGAAIHGFGISFGVVRSWVRWSAPQAPIQVARRRGSQQTAYKIQQMVCMPHLVCSIVSASLGSRCS